jgi:hypothetical protein
MDGAESSGEIIKYSDTLLIDFFEKFEKKGHLSSSIIILMSDQGLNLPSIYSLLNSEQYNIERSLPLLFFILPKEMDNFIENSKNLTLNENNFFTHYTLYNTIISLVEPSQTGSLLKEKVVSSCDDFFKKYDTFCKCR